MQHPERLSSIEAGFLLLDGPTTSHEAMGCMIFDGPIPYEHFCRRFERLTHVAPRYRQIPVPVPLHLSYPVWEFDSDFDIHYHVRHVQLEPPGDRAQLWELLRSIYADRLDHKKPLWAVYLVEGLEGNRGAIITKLHHSITDAAGVLSVYQRLYETERVEPKPLRPLDESDAADVSEPPARGGLGRTADAIVDNVIAVSKATAGLPRGLASFARSVVSGRVRTALHIIARHTFARTVRFPFNGAPSGNVHFADTEFSMADIAAVRNRAGGTLNDVILTVITGALERYAAKHGLKTGGRQMALAFTANLRVPGQHGNLINFSSGAMLTVPFGLTNPIERLGYVAKWTGKAKESNLAWGIWLLLAGWRLILTPPGHALIYRAVARPAVQRLLFKLMWRAPLHLYYSNIRGPEFPLYLLGRRVISRTVVPLLIPASGLSCASINYESSIRLCFSGDRPLTPDIEMLAQFASDAFEELVAAAGIQPKLNRESA